ncbi:hypothetical protein BZA05DRAFT_84060 [Tricharina praecox]|uniref:uncharacterized protein n=1 Tax=Tricharina praecox TaxID=43433 RepID=UPI00222105B0|nr:uncharacterized protein BZA05DRAFT_84060 [Tricharina praecox]KAI5849142.1 hypothetical protein BZA05DRAFT_84060 [Tricharina praecox]
MCRWMVGALDANASTTHSQPTASLHLGRRSNKNENRPRSPATAASSTTPWPGDLGQRQQPLAAPTLYTPRTPRTSLLWIFLAWIVLLCAVALARGFSNGCFGVVGVAGVAGVAGGPCSVPLIVGSTGTGSCRHNYYTPLDTRQVHRHLIHLDVWVHRHLIHLVVNTGV